MGVELGFSWAPLDVAGERKSSPHQKTKKAIIRPVVIPILAGIELGSRSRDGQILLSMMYIQEEPIMVLILIIS
jgi:hypothetical protein